MNSFRDRLVEDWRSRGRFFFLESIWSSALQVDDLPKVRQFLQSNNIDDVDVALSRPQEDGARTGWTRFYDSSGHCVVRIHETPFPKNSNNLKLTFAFENEQQRQQYHFQSTMVANSIRMIFGVSAARELICVSHFSNETVHNGSFSDIGYASPFDNQNVNRFEDPPIERTEINWQSAEAALLLDKAFSQPYPHERFILMWLALEALVSQIPGGGTNGDKRRYFFKKNLKSDVADQEMRRLFGIRNSIFKEGVFTNQKIDQDCWSLYAAIQLLMIKDGPQRAAFLEGYETYLNDGSADAIV